MKIDDGAGARATVSGELSTEVVGLTDYLRLRQEKHDSADVQRDSA